MPKTTDPRWKMIDDLDNILGQALKGDVKKKISTFTKIVYNCCKELFGLKNQKKDKLPSGQCRRQRKLAQLHQQNRSLKKAVE